MSITLSDIALAVVLGLGLGASHGLQTDHLAEITAQVVRKRGDDLQAFLVGAIFGLGHVVTTVLFGGIGLALGWLMPDKLGAFFEKLIGPMVVGVGLWALVAAVRRLGQPDHQGHEHQGHEHQGPEHQGHEHHGHEHHGHVHGNLRERLAQLKDQMLLGGLFALNPAPEAVAIFLVMMPGGRLESLRGLGGWQLGVVTLLSFGIGIGLCMGICALVVQRSLRGASRLGGAIARWTPVAAGSLIVLVGAALSLKGR